MKGAAPQGGTPSSSLPLVPLGHDVKNEGRPAAKRVSTDALAALVIILLPKEASAMVISQNGGYYIGSQSVIYMACTLHSLACRRPNIEEGLLLLV